MTNFEYNNILNYVKCVFCGKDRDRVKWMIAGPMHVFICDECVACCVEIIREQEHKESLNKALQIKEEQQKLELDKNDQ